MKSPNVCGQAYALTVMTPIKPGEEGPLRSYLEGLRDHDQRPLERLPRTHVGRWVIIKDFHNEDSWGSKTEKLELQYLIFSSSFDGDLDSYLDELCEKLAPEAKEIWGRCVGCPKSAKGEALKDYLKHNQIKTGLFFAAYADATVGQVKRALRQRDRVIEFASASQALGPDDLQRRFLEEFGS